MVVFTTNAQLSMKKADGGILISENGKRVLLFNTTPGDTKEKYKRSSYIHPLYGMNEEILTEDFPEGHLFQRGIFWAWHQVWINGERIGDPWEIKNFRQEITEIEFKKQLDQTIVLQSDANWLSDKWREKGLEVPYLKECTKITVHPQNGKIRRIDIEISLLALVKNLWLGGSQDKKGYGGFSAHLKLPEDVHFSGINGTIHPQEKVVRSDGFVNISGNFGKNKRKSGLVIVDNPQNPGYPQSWILSNKGSMQNAVWPGRRPVEISTTQPSVLKYSLLIYTGKLTTKKIKKIVEN